MASRRIAAEGRLDERFLDTLDRPATQKSFGGAIVHVITHSMHHRAQLLDVLSWEQQMASDHGEK